MDKHILHFYPLHQFNPHPNPPGAFAYLQIMGKGVRL